MGGSRRNSRCEKEKETVVVLPSSTQSTSNDDDDDDDDRRLEEEEVKEEESDDDDDESRWPRLADEDYIVFCFREDGAIHMVVKDGQHPESSHHVHHHHRIINPTSTTPVNLNRQFMYTEKAYNSTSHDCLVMIEEDESDIYPTNEAASILLSNKKGKGKGKRKVKESISLDTTSPRARGVSRGDERNDQIEEIKECKMMPSIESSSDSNDQSSDESSSSFAFPVLSCEEEVGSPVQMPKPDALHLRRKHNKARAARLHCCRF